jgi:multidrug efflux pump subunit AcrA (membrane-fusion protein)
LPESDIGLLKRGTRVPFTVSAYPGQMFSGALARVSRSVDPKTRTMPIELDVANTGAKLASGMYPDISWPVRRARPSLLVPASAIATTTERTFVIRVSGGRAQWVDVQKGAAFGDQVEVTGNLRAGDLVVRRATDEIRDGTSINVKPPVKT